jgi:hypothetical protein
MTIKEIKNNLPKEMIKYHKEMYIKNYIEIITNEKTGYNLNYNECLKNSNFWLIKLYIETWKQ